MSGNIIKEIYSPGNMGGNSLWSANLTNAADIPGFTNVRKLDICFPGGTSGAISAVAFCIEDDNFPVQ